MQEDWSQTIFFLQQMDPIKSRLKQTRLKEMDKAQMKRIVMMAIIKICGEALLISIIAGIIIGVIGNKNKWDTTLAYSNAFFIAGSLIFVAGGMSRLIAGRDWNNFQMLYAESLHEMSGSERARFILNTSSSVRFVSVGLLSGILLILASVVVLEMF